MPGHDEGLGHIHHGILLNPIIYCHRAAALEGLKTVPHVCYAAWRSARLAPAEVDMPQQNLKSVRGLDKVDPVWTRIRDEAEEAVRREPALASFIYSTILHHDALEATVVHRVAERLDHADVSGEMIRQAYDDALEDEPSIGEAFRADIVAAIDRDPAAHRYIEPLLYFKGFHAIQTHRLAHWLWKQGPQGLRALSAEPLLGGVPDRHQPGRARSGRGIFLDHATGLVVGETAVIDDDVSILQGVTLGGTGKEDGDRHPKIRRGVLIGAGAKILGNIEVGHCARIAAGSVVLKPVPHNVTVAGVPAQVVGKAGCAEPSRRHGPDALRRWSASGFSPSKSGSTLAPCLERRARASSMPIDPASIWPENPLPKRR